MISFMYLITALLAVALALQSITPLLDKYIVLSYVWGERYRTSLITVDMGVLYYSLT
jgi:hypothetical protein